MLFLLFVHSFFLCTSKNINECNKLWGMNNEINGVVVSDIGIYMCIDDPLNIYSTPNTNSQNNIILSDKQLDIQNFNETIQRKINNTYNFTNITEYLSTTTNNPTTTTNNPTTTTKTTTELPTTTTQLPTTTKTTTELPTTTKTTTELPTTIDSTTSELSTTTEVFSNNENDNINYQFNQTSTKKTDSTTKKNELEDINVVPDNTIIIIVTSISTLSIIGLIVCCYRFFPITKKICKKCYKQCTKKITENKELPITNNNLKNKKRRITPSEIKTNHVIDMPPQVITPRRKVSLGFNTMSNNMSSPTKKWYTETFKKELSEFNTSSAPPAPRMKTPKLKVPTLEIDLNKEGFLEKHVQNNKMINTRMNNLIHDMEDCKKTASTTSRLKKKSLKSNQIGRVKQRANSIENKIQKTDLRKVRLNSWTRNQEGTFQNN